MIVANVRNNALMALFGKDALATSVKSPRHDDVVAFHAADAEKSHSTVALGKSAICRVAI